MKTLFFAAVLTLLSIGASANTLECTETVSGNLSASKSFDTLSSREAEFKGTHFQVNLWTNGTEILQVVSRDLKYGVEFNTDLQGLHSPSFGMTLRDSSYTCVIK